MARSASTGPCLGRCGARRPSRRPAASGEFENLAAEAPGRRGPPCLGSRARPDKGARQRPSGAR
eukprot:2144562-Lingulodinium_polyedra.AAC.1